MRTLAFRLGLLVALAACSDDETSDNLDRIGADAEISVDAGSSADAATSSDGGGSGDASSGTGSADAAVADGGTGFGVPSDTLVVDLDPEAIEAVCTEARARVTAFLIEGLDGICALTAGLAGIFAGSLGGDSVQVCERSRTACASSPPVADDFDCDLESVTVECEATVGEMERCYEDSLSLQSTFLQTVEGFTCSELVDLSASPLSDLPPSPDSCVELLASCPDIEVGLPDFGD